MSEDKIKKEETKEESAQKAEAPAKAGKASKGKEDKGAKKPVKTKKNKPKRRSLQEGRVYIQASFNNTIVTITDPKGEVIAWSSAGTNGFKGAKKATPYAAQVSTEAAVTKAKVFGLEKVKVFIKGVGAGREQAIRGLHSAGIDILSITDLTPIAHNGCRRKKPRRV